MVAAANTHNVMTDSEPAGSCAVQRRRESRFEEFTEQTKLAAMLAKYLDPACTFWTALENKPISLVSALFQKRRGCRSGLPDQFVLYRGKPIFVELKSRAGVATKVQKQVRLELLPAAATWWMARSARAALMALHLSGVEFRRHWKPPRLQPWEGPFADPTQRLPQAPDVAARRRAARRRSRERQRIRDAAHRAAAARYEGAQTPDGPPPAVGCEAAEAFAPDSRPAASGAPAAVRIDRGNSRRYLRRDDRRPSNDSGAGCDAQAVGGSRLRARRI